jgi:hypothetical protein
MVDDPNEAVLSSDEAAIRLGRRTSHGRKHQRIQFTALAEYKELHSGLLIKARTSDLSATGCFVDTHSPCPVGMTLMLRLTKENRTFETGALVAYSKVGEGMGLLFIDSKPEQLGVLKRWLGELSGEVPAEADTSDQTEHVPAEKTLKQEPHFVLNKLILALLRKGVLTEAEAVEILQDPLH